MTFYVYMSPETLLEKAREMTALAHKVIHMQRDKKVVNAHAYFLLGHDVNKGGSIKIRIGEDVK